MGRTTEYLRMIMESIAPATDTINRKIEMPEIRLSVDLDFAAIESSALSVRRTSLPKSTAHQQRRDIRAVSMKKKRMLPTIFFVSELKKLFSRAAYID